MSLLGELDGLRDGGVRGHAFHLKELCGSESQEIEEIGVEADGSAADPSIEVRIQARPAAKHAVYELAHPASVARVEPRRSTIERRVQQLTTAKVGADFRGGDPGIRDATRPVQRNPTSARRPMVLICT